jgi:hypothetical protein
VQGALVARLRAVVDLARLPAAVRTDGWRADLASARAALPADTPATEDTLAADRLLAAH